MANITLFVVFPFCTLISIFLFDATSALLKVNILRLGNKDFPFKLATLWI